MGGEGDRRGGTGRREKNVVFREDAARLNSSLGTYPTTPGSSTTNLTSNFPNPANIDIIINTCEAPGSTADCETARKEAEIANKETRKKVSGHKSPIENKS